MFKKASNIAVALTIAVGAASLSGCDNQTSQQAASSVTQVDNAHWVTRDTLLINAPQNTRSVTLRSTFHDGLVVNNAFNKVELPVELKEKFPHLTHLTAFQIKDDIDFAKLLKSNNRVIFQNEHAQNVSAEIQLYGAIDDLFTASNTDADEVMDYGATVIESGVQFKLWAPTAVSVDVLLFDKDKAPLSPVKLAMVEDIKTGVWNATGDKSLKRAYYQYQITVYHSATKQFETVTVTDPYSLSLSTNSKYSQIIDLDDSSTKPEGWDQHVAPVVDAPEDLILYETHIRDFSASETALSNEAHRGKYKAFLEQNSFGKKHLMMLQDAGLNTVHLLPTYDISTVNEDPNIAISLSDPMDKVCQQFSDIKECAEVAEGETLRQRLESFDPRSGDAQALIEKIRGKDDYNWGYDPYHYTVPEGSYAVNPEGEHRIVEFREMVQHLHESGFKVIMDVVYNHTFASGLAEKSVLDKVVPGYYHRLNIKDGSIEQSTCCDNSATEHAMMAKLMKDSLVVWARDYKIDGFRFDLMGHQPKAAMLESRDAVHAVDPDNYFYGEGWNFGEVANNAQFIQASQQELSGTEIGTFTDRLRDAVRGGNFQTNAEKLRYDQGVGNGLFVIPNEMQNGDNQQALYNNAMDIVRLGLAGNLKTFKFNDITGNAVSGTQVLYGGNPAGYALDPADTINYVSKHDNQTLWDNHQYRLPFDMTSDERVRVHAQSLSYALLAQGIPFLHMGSELMRSKAFLRDSYDYGDWFNAVDFSYQSNNYDVGLPPAEKDKSNWPIISKVLENNGKNDDVSSEQIKLSANIFADFINIRSSTVLFRLRTGEQVNQRVSFKNTGPNHQAGVIVMSIVDLPNEQLDANFEEIVVVFNNNRSEQTVALDNAKQLSLHPRQQNGADNVVKKVVINAGEVIVPALTTAVFVR